MRSKPHTIQKSKCHLEQRLNVKTKIIDIKIYIHIHEIFKKIFVCTGFSLRHIGSSNCDPWESLVVHCELLVVACGL